MSIKMRAISFFFLRLATPTSRASAFWKFAILLLMIHLLSLWIEYLLTQTLIYPQHLRFMITAGAATPFVALALFGFSMASESRRKLKTLALTDSLTGLPNRRAFFDWIEKARTYRRTGFLVLLDADRFKQVNDTLGHDAGDRALLAIAGWMKRHAGPDVRFARVGGEEFGALITGAPAISMLESIGAELCPQVKFDTGENGEAASISLSAGSTVFDTTRSSAEMLREADMALYRAKASGGGLIYAYREKAEPCPPPSHTSALSAPRHVN